MARSKEKAHNERIECVVGCLHCDTVVGKVFAMEREPGIGIWTHRSVPESTAIAAAAVGAISQRTFNKLVLIVTPALLPTKYGIIQYVSPSALAANGTITVVVNVVVTDVILRD